MERLKDKPFVMLGVNSDEDRDTVKGAIEEKNVTWRSWFDGGSTEGPIASKWNVTSWPTVYVLDHKGVIRHIDLEGKPLDEAVDKLLEAVEKATANGDEPDQVKPAEEGENDEAAEPARPAAAA